MSVAVDPTDSGLTAKGTSPGKSKNQHLDQKHSAVKKHQFQATDWTQVTDAEERRRIQNRIAQRKFRMLTNGVPPLYEAKLISRVRREESRAKGAF